MGQAQRSRKSMPHSSMREIDIISPEERGGRARGTAKPTPRGNNRNSRPENKRAGNARERNVRERNSQQEVEMWEIGREDGQPRMMRLAEQPAERQREGRPARKRAENQRPRPVSREDQGRRHEVRPINREVERQRAARAVKRRKAKRRKVLLCRCFTLVVVAVCLILIYQTTGAVYRMVHERRTGEQTEDKGKGIIEVISDKWKIEPPVIIEDYLEINEYSRPGTELKKVNSVFVHYTANPGTTAQQNRSYFANLAETHERSASAHFIIGYDGDLVQCIPLEEQAYAVATRNEDSISIECCYQDEDGKFTQETYDTLVHTLAWLTQEYHLSAADILRHYDCGGKMCPIYYVEHEDAWEQLLADVENYEPMEEK